MVPHDDFTPHGYLDNPYHSWKLNPGGVLRSLPPLGMGWHVPNLGSYCAEKVICTQTIPLAGLYVQSYCTINPQTPSWEFRDKCHDLFSALRYSMREKDHAASCPVSERRTPFYMRKIDHFVLSGKD